MSQRLDLRGYRFAGLLIALLVTAAGCSAKVDSVPAIEPQASAAPATPSAPAAASDPFWQGLERHEIQLDQKLLVVKGSKGVIGCPYLNIGTFRRAHEACAIVPAVNIDGMLDSKVTDVTTEAEALGIEVGMSGREALERIR